MKVLITGGAGFIGSNIVDRLIEEKNTVLVVDNLSTGKESSLNPKAIFYRADIRDIDVLKHIFEKERPEVVNHHAAQVDVRKSMDHPQFDASVNVLGTLNILKLCSDYVVKKVIFASTCAVYNKPMYLPLDEKHPVDPLSAYGVAKYSAELYLRLFSENYGLRYTVFRYGNVYGPRQDPKGECGVVAIFSQQMLTGVRPTIFGDGNKTRDYVHVGDVVGANMLAMDGLGDSQVFNLGWGREITDFQVFETVRQAVGVEVEPCYSPKRPGEVDRVCLDSGNAQNRLNWEPEIKFEDGIPLTVAYYKKASKTKSV